MKVIIAGASGFVGQALIERLLATTDHELIALSRRAKESSNPRLRWLKCDLFSLKDVSEALKGCQAAYYLVHSMLPSASLTQGEFFDLDLIIADNFARAARTHGLSRIVYLGGMIPPGKKLSWHLKSRLEVESTLAASGARLTTLRAGMIIGPEGSSFLMAKRLVERLPALVCPSWTGTRFQPVALKDAISVLVRALEDPRTQGPVYDVGGPTVTTYRDLILKTAKALGKHRVVVPLDIIPLGLSRFWVSLITGAPRALVFPLVLSLIYPMVVSPELAWPYPEDVATPLDEALAEAVAGRSGREAGFSGFVPEQRDVRSVQRLPLPPGKDAAWIADEYFRWLPRLLPYGIRVDVSDPRLARFYDPSGRQPLLVLERSFERSTPDRQLLYIVGGILAKSGGRGRLEFREALDHSCVLAAIHEFRPTLPWPIYRSTQARAHLFVMKSFARHLRRIS
jgi:uncharacterized protein YbjT (DUF2867 family)